MRVLMLTTNSSLLDGINRHILNIAPWLNIKDDIEVAVCTVNKPGGLNSSLEEQGVRTFSLNAASGHDYKIFYRFYSLMKSYKPDIIHSHVIALYERILLSVFFKKVKYISTIHGIPDDSARMTLRMRLENILNSLFSLHESARCYISRGVRDALLSETQSPIFAPIVYNPINLFNDILSKRRIHQLLKLDSCIPIVGTSCRIAKVKNPELFTEVMCKVLRTNNFAHAVVMGDGDIELRTRCEKIISNYGVENRFHWLGFRDDAPELVADLNCFILTSTSEGMPTSLLECMSANTPFAFLRGNGGLKDIEKMADTEGDFCIIGERNNLDEFVNNICQLINDVELQSKYSEKSKIVAEKYFSMDIICERMHEIYRQVMNEDV